jgi:hypothetical protein
LRLRPCPGACSRRIEDNDADAKADQLVDKFACRTRCTALCGYVLNYAGTATFDRKNAAYKLWRATGVVAEEVLRLAVFVIITHQHPGNTPHLMITRGGRRRKFTRVVSVEA